MVDVVPGFADDTSDHTNDKDASSIQGSLANGARVAKLDNDDFRVGGRVLPKLLNAGRDGNASLRHSCEVSPQGVSTHGCRVSMLWMEGVRDVCVNGIQVCQLFNLALVAVS